MQVICCDMTHSAVSPSGNLCGQKYKCHIAVLLMSGFALETFLTHAIHVIFLKLHALTYFHAVLFLEKIEGFFDEQRRMIYDHDMHKHICD